MIMETTQRLKSAAPLLSQITLLNDCGQISTHAGRNSSQARRHFNVSAALTAKVRPRPKPRAIVEIPGLERVTYGERMHYVPGLSKPVNPDWERGFKDPNRYKSPPVHEMPLHKEKPCYIFNQRTNALEGVRQALWLTKTKLTSGLPPQLLALAQNPTYQIPDQDERVQNAIKHARFWDTTEGRPKKEKYCYTLLNNLLHMCGSLQSSHPALSKRILAEKFTLAASWKRGEDLFQVRGKNGLLLNSMTPLPNFAGKQEVADTADHVLETFYPVSPAIDLQKVHVYKEDNYTGFRSDYPYPNAHTLFFLEAGDVSCKLYPDQLRAKMIMFSFGSALARAHTLYGTQLRVLDHPITVQAVGNNGRVFQFVVFQLNTTDLHEDSGIKNQVWVDEDVLLYDFAKVQPLIKKKQVVVPAGLSGYNPETFSKFLALYLNGAV
ncbi:39S ribosomal protein L37, mitochondrial [Lampris incognitus]|uniref:39S ribosomal protein L37, mitochondrial n=1 Tax=Lampris incognitus TaxID=2546036 RepID=UPI0024B60847|nr:39S ribosomal protein L37, mitochondrial [Lampris incognitus]